MQSNQEKCQVEFVIHQIYSSKLKGILFRESLEISSQEDNVPKFKEECDGKVSDKYDGIWLIIS